MKQESQKLRAEMKQMQQTPGVESDNPVLAKMAQEIQALKAELADLQDAMAAFQQQTDEPTATPDDVVGLVQSRRAGPSSNPPLYKVTREQITQVDLDNSLVGQDPCGPATCGRTAKGFCPTQIGSGLLKLLREQRTRGNVNDKGRES
jgi:cell pole-organizing protein PopZ